jgi:hypothetical protein
MDRNELPLEPHLPEVPLGASKMISRPWYVWHKPCTYLAPTLTSSLNGPKWDSTWATSPRSSIGCLQNDFQAYGTFGANRIPILHQDQYYFQVDRNELPLEPHRLGAPSGVSKMITEPMVRLAQTVHLSWVKISTISKQTETSFHLSPSSTSTIRCVQNDFWPYGTFSANRAPILLRHWHRHRMDQNKTPQEPHRLGVPSALSKTISKPRVCLVQTVPPSSTDTNTVSKLTKIRFDMTHVT